MRKEIFILILSVLSEKISAQISYPNVREADVAWSKTIWRIIDLREKINLPFYYPTNEMTNRNSLFQIIKKGIMEGKLSVFDPTPSVFSPGEEFSKKFSLQEAQNIFVREKKIMKQDSADADLILSTVMDTISPAEIMQYLIKEEWFFDRKRSEMDVRIIGIAPVIETRDEQGEFKGYKTLFWLYYPDCRNFFSKYKIFNPYNDAEQRTVDEIFQKRLFGSYISMESNVYNRTISSYTDGMETLLEAEKIKERIFNFEQDLWHY